MLRKLKAIAFTGPIGFQGFGIAGDARSILAPTMEAWRKLSAAAAAGADQAPRNHKLAGRPRDEGAGVFSVLGLLFVGPVVLLVLAVIIMIDNAAG